MCSILLVASRHNGYNLEIPFIFEGCLHADVLFTGLEYNDLGILYCVVGRSEGLAPLSFSTKQLTLS